MVLISPRIQFLEINDEAWFPSYLREKVQSCLTLLWTLKVPPIQQTSPAQLVSSTLLRILDCNVSNFTYVDFCAGAGGPTPTIEKDLNRQLSLASLTPVSGSITSSLNRSTVQFVLTDLHPHIAEWTKVSKRSENVTFVAESVNAANAPPALHGNSDRRIFRLYNLAFHHFDDQLATAILHDTLETADGFGIFELQERTISSIITVLSLGPVLFLITPFYFWRSPGHLFFTYIIPIIPFVVIFDGLVSSLRTRTDHEIMTLMQGSGITVDGWKIFSGGERHTWPTGYMSWVIALKNQK
ncbi:hypothetical protein K3495_g941 [Podosphaera aphanis]|nr:hypothetical protein K3495_g941 [Podosphaera aphanis]